LKGAYLSVHSKYLALFLAPVGK